jgi:RNA polymerase sigma-70 factor (sigma-E family)
VTFEEFAAARVPVLVRTAVQLCGDLGLAEDLVQEVLIKVHRQWDRIATLESRDGYVRRMLVNEHLSWRRKWARITPSGDIAVADSAPDHSTGHADRELLRAQIGRLSRRKQAVLALRYYDGLSDAEIADAMGCRESTVRSLASRALASLRVDPVLRTEYSSTLIPAKRGQAR